MKEAEELISAFSIFVADASTTKYFAAKSVLVHCRLLLEKETDINNI